MCALAHYLEDEGIPTTLISLVGEHSRKMRPPRALWVPFELGRPLGAPEDANFQRRVLRTALDLLEEPEGPVHAEFPDDAPGGGDMTGWACPVSFRLPEEDGAGPPDRETKLLGEIGSLRPWHDLARERRGRSTVGASGVEVEDIARYVLSFLEETRKPNPRPGLDEAHVFKLCSDDLVAFYTEAATAQPGPSTSREIADWFWGETEAGAMLLELKRRAGESDDPGFRLIGQRLLVPRSQDRRL